MQLADKYQLARAALLSAIRDVGPDTSAIPQNTDCRKVLGDLLISSNANWKNETLELIDKVWQAEADTSLYVPVNVINRSGLNFQGTRITVWKGDITTVQGSEVAIVNAANERGEGCFQPDHRCIDNVIHRAAGPRLRMECKEQMNRRGPLTAGSEPFVTNAYHLPSQWVVHATGPMINDRSHSTEASSTLLFSTYLNVLDAAANAGAKTVVLPCISTGLFGFPAGPAADIARSAVANWVSGRNGVVDNIVFNVYLDSDWELYQANFNSFFGAQNVNGPMEVDETKSKVLSKTALANKWIADADAVLICAGAGMSVKDGEMVYTNPDDFAKAYPWFPKWGYKTSYEAMGLVNDRSVPISAKWALFAKHMDNMRWKFTPNSGYQQLRELVGDKSYFVLTSNVDACFERAGFDKSRIYTPQGEWTYVQCVKPCHKDSVFESRPYLDAIVPNISSDGNVPLDLIPSCPRCGGQMFGNVRAGSNFLHSKYESQSLALQRWMEDQIRSNKTIVVIEIGAGFNTPTVTRFPVESFSRELGERARFIRINPSDPQVPEHLRALSFASGWQTLQEILKDRSSTLNGALLSTSEAHHHQAQVEEGLAEPKALANRMKRYFGHFDWRVFLHQLRENKS